MGKISVEIDDKIEEALRRYIAEHHWKNPYGKLSQIVEDAVKEWLKKEGVVNEQV